VGGEEQIIAQEPRDYATLAEQGLASTAAATSTDLFNSQVFFSPDSKELKTASY